MYKTDVEISTSVFLFGNKENYGRYRASIDNPVRLGYVSFVSGDRAPLPSSLFLIKLKIIFEKCVILAPKKVVNR